MTSIDGPNLGLLMTMKSRMKRAIWRLPMQKLRRRKLAQSLGVHLVGIVSFSDNSGGGVMPVAYGAKAMAASGVAATPLVFQLACKLLLIVFLLRTKYGNLTKNVLKGIIEK